MPKRILLTCDVNQAQAFDFNDAFKAEDWKAEKDCYNALRTLGHEVERIAIYDDIRPLIEKTQELKPDVIFNQCDHFNGISGHDRNIAAFYELLNVPYTGSSPAALMLCKNKALTKELLTTHRIKVPQHTVFKRDHKFTVSKRMRFPQIIKPLSDEASYGISNASIVTNIDETKERIRYIHETVKSDAICEQYIEGIELYVSILGNHRLRVFPFRQLTFPEDQGAPQIATYNVKWNKEFRKKWNIRYEFARLKDEALEKKIARISKRIYRILHLQGYGRLDLRVTSEGQVYVIEANPNPYLAREEDFALSAKKAGFTYEKLIDKIIQYAEECHPRMAGT
ncbi:ATP-grasp domain-containing protein [Candidatus Omnitrophota bacterium]